MTREEKTIIYFKDIQKKQCEDYSTKQELKETIKLWIDFSLALASICIILVVVPFLFFTYAGIGHLQLIVCILWYAFWVSFTATVVEKIW